MTKENPSVKIGYIRVSRDKQTTALQEDAMKNEQCGRVFTDKMSGKRFDRPEFLRMLDVARPGDVIVVGRLDRLGRSLKQLIETVTMLGERGIELRSLKENIDTLNYFGSANSKLIERDFTREQRRDFIIRKEILLEFPDNTDHHEISRQERALIREYGANDPSKGYNRSPKFKSEMRTASRKMEAAVTGSSSRA